MDNMSQGERLVAIGGALTIVVFVLFELIIREYFISTMSLTVGSLAAAAVWLKHNNDKVEWAVNADWLIRTLGLVGAYVILLELLDDIRFDRLDEGGAVLGGIILYAGGVLMFMGSRQMKSAD